MIYSIVFRLNFLLQRGVIKSTNSTGKREVGGVVEVEVEAVEVGGVVVLAGGMKELGKK